eukprot:gb/GEZN01004486.1/.p1 GENE.gb/GEZN01004486.1/~~gb/GEZN01004486.1/.p1  ORF type:complete len:312 (-),score=86.62 gb/GEZN01004486.1/:140-1075(-)
MRVMTTAENAALFVSTAKTFTQERKHQLGELSFDKDDEDAMQFVSALSNLRMQVFGIPMQSQFTLKGIAGNIVHAIATTNAIAAGLIVLEAFKIIANDKAAARTTWIKRYGPRLLQPQLLDKPNPSCFICGGNKPQLVLTVDTDKFTVGQLFAMVLKKRLSFVDPSISTTDKHLGLQDDLEEVLKKPLAEFYMGHNVMLNVEDYMQTLELQVRVLHDPKISINEEDYREQFVLGGEMDKLSEASEQAKQDQQQQQQQQAQQTQAGRKKRKEPSSPPAVMEICLTDDDERPDNSTGKRQKVQEDHDAIIVLE